MTPVARRVGLLALVLCAACGRAKAPAAAPGVEPDDAPDASASAQEAAAAAPAADATDAGAGEVLTAAPDALEALPPAPLALDDVTALAALAGDDYALPLQARGGTPPYAWSVAAGTLPAGLALMDGTNATTQLAGKPAHAGSATVTIQVADAVGVTAMRPLTLLVRGRPWALYRAKGGLRLVDLTRDGGNPLSIGSGSIQAQPGGALDLLGVDASGVYGVDLGGAEPARVLLAVPSPDGAGSLVGLSWSRDGKRLAYMGGGDNDRDLFVVDTTAGPGVPRRANAVRAAGDTVGYFVSVGASLVYSIWNKDHGYSAYVVSADPPGTPQLLATATSGLGWSPSPDHTRLIYSAREWDPVTGDHYVAYLIGVDGHGPASPVKLEGVPFSSDGYSPGFSWASDSSAIQLSRPGPNANAALYQLRLDDPNEKPRLMYEGPCAAGSFGKSPDGRWLAFAGCGLWLAPLGADGPGPFHQLVPDPGPEGYGVSLVGWTPDGGRLSYVGPTGLAAVDTTGTAPGMPVNLYAGLPSGYRMLDFSPDGSKLAVRVVNGPVQQIFLVPFAGPTPGAPVRMSADAAPGAYQYTPQRAGAWSRDGTRFVYEALVGRTFQVFAVNVDGGVPGGARLISADDQVDCCQTPQIVQR